MHARTTSAASVLEHQRAVSDFRHRKHFSFRKGRISPCIGLLPLTQNHFWPYEIRGEPIGIPCVVIVRVAVGVHIAEVVAVVAIRGTLPPKSGGTPERSNRSATSFYRNAPNEY